MLSLVEILPLREKWKKNNKIVVFTNGVFDILHRGHVEYLNKARKLGDVLVLGLNTDESVQRLKGPKRPILSLEDRAYILESLSAVDYVVPFAEDTPYDLISHLLPDVLVKGADYRVEDIVGADIVMANGGIVMPVDLVEGKSTTGIIETIQKRFCDK